MNEEVPDTESDAHSTLKRSFWGLGAVLAFLLLLPVVVYFQASDQPMFCAALVGVISVCGVWIAVRDVLATFDRSGIRRWTWRGWVREPWGEVIQIQPYTIRGRALMFAILTRSAVTHIVMSAYRHPDRAMDLLRVFVEASSRDPASRRRE
jgi:hypothetical protein